MVSRISSVTLCHSSVIRGVLCGSFPFFRGSSENRVDIGAPSNECNDPADVVSCFGKSRIRLRMLWGCLGVDELADIRKEHSIAGCGDSGVQGSETHVPLCYAEDRVDGIFIYAFIRLCALFLLSGIFTGIGLPPL